MKIVVNSSPLIAFAILQKLNLLPILFTDILIPQAVYDEVTEHGKPHAESLRVFAQGKVVSAQNQMAVQLLTQDVDRGESEVIVLALENGITDVLIDDAKGRRFASLNGVNPIGTVGILLRAKQQGHIELIKPLLDLLIANRIRIGADLYTRALIRAGEN